MNTKKDGPYQVTVVMPSYNEERFIKESINSLMDDYFKKYCELLVVDGMSTDKTREVVQSFVKKGLPIKILKNKKRTQAYGLNRGIAEARGKIIVRADAHCVYPRGYIKRCVNLLEETGAANVGGVMKPEGKSNTQKAIARAMQHPVGVGDAKWHTGNFSGHVDTVYLGTFKKELCDEIGLYDTRFRTNEDAELNLRILKAGKKIYLDSSIKVTYFPRESLKDLAVQYFRYGRGRCYTTLKHKKITSLRQIAPVALVIGLPLSIGMSFWQPYFLIFPVSYFLVLFLAPLLSGLKERIPIKIRILTSIAFFLMHMSWGLGFLSGLVYQNKPNG